MKIRREGVLNFVPGGKFVWGTIIHIYTVMSGGCGENGEK